MNSGADYRDQVIDTTGRFISYAYGPNAFPLRIDRVESRKISAIDSHRYGRVAAIGIADRRSHEGNRACGFALIKANHTVGESRSRAFRSHPAGTLQDKSDSPPRCRRTGAILSSPHPRLKTATDLGWC